MLCTPVISLLQDTAYQLHLELLTNEVGLEKKITIPRIQKPGLALTGDTSNLHTGRIQILGRSEIRYLSSLPKRELTKVLEKICQVDISAFIITRNNEALPELLKTCNKHNIAVLRTDLLTSTFINRISRFLEDKLTASTCIHGVLMDIFGVGTLLIGKSGIGKSECALDLILRGHRLVADDIVNVKKKPPATLYGTGSEIIKYHMEIRGLGIINIKDLFGIAAIRDRKIIEMVIELQEWDPKIEYDRLGIDEKRYTMLDVVTPFIQIPVRPGRNLSAIIEIAARNQLLKLDGHYSAREFKDKLEREISPEGNEKTTWELLE